MLLSIPAVLTHLVVNATDPQVPENGLVHLVDPDLQKYDYAWVLKYDVWPKYAAGRTELNLGTFLGLPRGSISLIPLLLFWCLILILIIRLRRLQILSKNDLTVTTMPGGAPSP